MRGSFTLIIYHLLGKKTKKQIKKSCIFIFCRNASVLFVTLFWYLVIWADQSSLKSVPSRDIQYLSGIKRQSDAEFDDRCLRCLCPATVYQWHLRTSPNLNLITGYHRVHFVLVINCVNVMLYEPENLSGKYILSTLMQVSQHSEHSVTKRMFMGHLIQP